MTSGAPVRIPDAYADDRFDPQADKASGFKTINIPDAYADPRFNQTVDKNSGYRTRNILCMAMRARSDPSKTIGVIQFINKLDGTAFNDVDESVVASFLEVAAQMF